MASIFLGLFGPNYSLISDLKHAQFSSQDHAHYSTDPTCTFAQNPERRIASRVSAIRQGVNDPHDAKYILSATKQMGAAATVKAQSQTHTIAQMLDHLRQEKCRAVLKARNEKLLNVVEGRLHEAVEKVCRSHHALADRASAQEAELQASRSKLREAEHVIDTLRAEALQKEAEITSTQRACENTLAALVQTRADATEHEKEIGLMKQRCESLQFKLDANSVFSSAFDDGQIELEENLRQAQRKHQDVLELLEQERTRNAPIDILMQMITELEYVLGEKAEWMINRHSDLSRIARIRIWSESSGERWESRLTALKSQIREYHEGTHSGGQCNAAEDVNMEKHCRDWKRSEAVDGQPPTEDQLVRI